MQSVGHAFKNALTTRSELAVIAEVKRKSPSAGDLRPGLGAAETAIEYVRGGAVLYLGADRGATLRWQPRGS